VTRHISTGKILTFPLRSGNISFHCKNNIVSAVMKETSSRRKASAAPPNVTNQADYSARDKPYHHGTLPHALLEAAELVLRRDGIRGLTL
jgi:hypothetical protein